MIKWYLNQLNFFLPLFSLSLSASLIYYLFDSRFLPALDFVFVHIWFTPLYTRRTHQAMLVSELLSGIEQRSVPHLFIAPIYSPTRYAVKRSIQIPFDFESVLTVNLYCEIRANSSIRAAFYFHLVYIFCYNILWKIWERIQRQKLSEQPRLFIWNRSNFQIHEQNCFSITCPCSEKIFFTRKLKFESDFARPNERQMCEFLSSSMHSIVTLI